MAESRGKISRSQRMLLEQAQNADDPFDIPRFLYEAIRSTEDSEPLDPLWKQIWGPVREKSIQIGGIPPHILEKIDEAVAAIHSLDEEIKKLRLKPDDRVCLLLGAGASAPQPSSIPTVAHLLPELWRRAGKIGRDDIDRLATWCESQQVSNIEDLLTAAHLANFAAKNSSVTGLLDYFLFRAGSAEQEGPSYVYGRRRGVMPRVDSSSIALLQDTLQVLFGLLTGTMIPAPPNKGHEAVVDSCGTILSRR